MTTKPPTDLEPAYTVTDLMTLTGYSRPTLHRLMKRGWFGAVCSGEKGERGTYRVTRHAYRAWCERYAAATAHDAYLAQRDQPEPLPASSSPLLRKVG